MFMLVYCIKAAEEGLGWGKTTGGLGTGVPSGVQGRSPARGSGDEVLFHTFSPIYAYVFSVLAGMINYLILVLFYIRNRFSICTVYVHVMLLLFLSDVRLSHLH